MTRDELARHYTRLYWAKAWTCELEARGHVWTPDQWEEIKRTDLRVMNHEVRPSMPHTATFWREWVEAHVADAVYAYDERERKWAIDSNRQKTIDGLQDSLVISAKERQRAQDAGEAWRSEAIRLAGEVDDLKKKLEAFTVASMNAKPAPTQPMTVAVYSAPFPTEKP